MSEDLEKEKAELIRLLEDAAPEAKQVESMGQAMVESARFVQDVAKPLAEVYREIPADQMPPGEWARQKQGWVSWHGMAAGLQGMLPNVNSFSAMTMSSANSAISGAVMWFGPGAHAVQPSPAAAAAMTNIYQTLERYPLVERAFTALRRLGLDSRPGRKSPLTLLEEARNALGRPVFQDGGSVPVLIGLRECIDAAVTELIRRLPEQRPHVAGGWKGKVASIGCQCARPALLRDHFDRRGIEIDAILNELSGTKQLEIPRTRLQETFNRGLLSLIALLDSIDESKLKPS